jgi:DNA-binding CsgD family transcriptional regulator
MMLARARSVPTLTAREIEVLKLIADSVRTKIIATILGVSAKTVEFHKRNLYSKIGANNMATAVRWAMRTGYV